MRVVDDSELMAPDECSDVVFFFNDTATTEIYTLSLHDALPISTETGATLLYSGDLGPLSEPQLTLPAFGGDRKSTRLNSSHMSNSYAVFCLKKKTNIEERRTHFNIQLFQLVASCHNTAIVVGEYNHFFF